jgi:hypothetical protein
MVTAIVMVKMAMERERSILSICWQILEYYDLAAEAALGAMLVVPMVTTFKKR